MGVGRLLLRATLGGFFAGHGLQKLAGWFGGGGPAGTGAMFEQIGLRPGRRQALAAGAAETGGGTLLALGLATPAAVSMLSAVMVSAVRHVHWRNGPWNTNGGWELHAIVLAALAGLAEEGPGPLSLDAALGIELRGAPVALVALGAGTLGSLAASELGSRLPAPAPPPEAESDAAPADEPVSADR
ncbi:MAG TPA: DoxX family membrane protein [Gaiellaceae bacterium]|nr:DoxX family membrane protein [Gaiellaceae bacterium]